MNSKEIFADRLRSAMNKQNMKQIDLVRTAESRHIKLGKSHVSQYVSGKTLPRPDILNFLAETLHTSPEWLIGNTDTSKSEPEIMSAEKTLPEKSEFQIELVQTRDSKKIDPQIELMGGTKMREFKKSSKLDNVLYDVRGPVVEEASRMEEAGTHVLKLNIGNPAPFGFRTPDEVIYDMRQQLTECEGYSDAKGLFSARKAIMQYAQLKHIPNVSIGDIYTGNGVSELINLSLSALLDNGDEILIPSPDYPCLLYTSRCV